MVLLFVFGFLGGLVRLARLKIVLTPLVKVPLLSIVMIGWAASFFNFLLAMRAGELTKGYYLKKLYGSSFVQATSAVLVDRLADFLLMTLSILMIGFFGGGDLFPPLLLAVVFIVPLGILYLLAWQGVRIFSLFESLVLQLDFPYQEKILDLFDNLIKGFAVARWNPQALLLVFFLSFAALILDTTGLFFMFRAFSVSAPFLLVLLANSLFALSFLIPSPPAYIGTVEVAGSLIFILILSLGKNLAASVTLFFHIYSAFVVGLLGLPAILYLHLRMTKNDRD